jgi:hypothetical protein
MLSDNMAGTSSGPPRRKKVNYVESGDDGEEEIYNSEEGTNSPSSEAEDSDSEFEKPKMGARASKKKTNEKAAAKATKPKATKRGPANRTKKAAEASPVVAESRQSIPRVMRRVSPGGRRVGLSRNAPVKPLSPVKLPMNKSH